MPCKTMKSSQRMDSTSYRKSPLPHQCVVSGTDVSLIDHRSFSAHTKGGLTLMVRLSPGFSICLTSSKSKSMIIYDVVISEDAVIMEEF